MHPGWARPVGIFFLSFSRVSRLNSAFPAMSAIWKRPRVPTHPFSASRSHLGLAGRCAHSRYHHAPVYAPPTLVQLVLSPPSRASQPRGFSTTNTNQPPTEAVYIPEVDLEDFEEYSLGGYHPIVIGDTFCDGRYEVVHKLGFGGYSTIWLAKDKQLQRYVSLKILIAHEFSKSTEAKILRWLCKLKSSRSKTHPRLA